MVNPVLWILIYIPFVSITCFMGWLFWDMFLNRMRIRMVVWYTFMIPVYLVLLLVIRIVGPIMMFVARIGDDDSWKDK